MNELVPIVTGLAGGLTVGRAAKSAEEFVAAYFGHKGESIPTMLGDALRRKKENAEQVVGKAYLTLLNIGVHMKDLKDIPLNIAAPIIEGASRAEDDALQDRWANLLANAGDPRERSPIEPVFTTMLADLSSREVVFLDSLLSSVKNTIINRNRVNLQVLYREKGLAKNRIPDIVPHFREQATLDEQDAARFEIMMDILTRSRIIIENIDKTHGDYRFSQLGLAFVLACQPPEPASATLDSASGPLITA